MKLKEFAKTTVTIGLLVTTLHAAQATTLYKLNDPVTVTSLSGTTLPGGGIKVLGGTKDFKAIHRITNWEKANNPCKMKVKMRHLNDYKATTDTKELWSNCDNDKITVGYSDTETYIRGIQVCLNNSVIKGLRVWGSKLNRTNGSLTNVAQKEDKRFNCSKWKTKYFCPAGHIATQIEANHDGGTGLPNYATRTGSGYRGIKLVCREVAVKS